jgi:hypothetical protein
VTINLDELTWDDLEAIEEIVGRPIGRELADGNPSVRVIRALVVWKRRQTDPLFTMEDLGKISPAEASVTLKGNEVPPTGGIGGS